MTSLTRLALTSVAALAVVLPTAATASATAGAAPATAAPAAAAPASATAPVESYVRCGADVGDGRTTVLLVHGTAGTADETWSWNWERTLPTLGYSVCTVDVPDRELTNMARSAEFVAEAARYTYAKSGRKIAMVGHSQGGTLVTWVAKFFPDVAAKTDDVISLAGDFGGTRLLTPTCLDGACPAISWQLIVGSRHLKALRNAPAPAGTSFSSIYSKTDEVVFPQPNASTLPGASNVSLQDVCGIRLVGHAGILADSVAYTLVKDALSNPGPTRLSRLSLGTKLNACAAVQQPGAEPLGYLKLAPTITNLLNGVVLGGQPDLPREPALPAYAEPFAS